MPNISAKVLRPEIISETKFESFTVEKKASCTTEPKAYTAMEQKNYVE